MGHFTMIKWIAALGFLLFESLAANAQGVPCQWNYSFDSSGQAVASYCGNGNLANGKAYQIGGTSVLSSVGGVPQMPSLATSVNGATTTGVPYQVGPFELTWNSSGNYNDNTNGNIFQISGFADNTGSRPVVAMFGEGLAGGTSSLAWGGNFVAYANAVGATAQGLEIDYGNLVAGGNASGLDVNVTGGNATTAMIMLSAAAANSTAETGIRFYKSSFGNPIVTALMDTSGGMTSVNGIDLSGGTFSGSAFKSTGFSVDGTGHAFETSLKLALGTVGSLPTCNSAAEGTLYAVTDSNSTAFYATLVGGGTNHVMAYCNGTNWTVH